MTSNDDALKWRWPQNEDDLKNEDNFLNKDDLKNEDTSDY